MWHWEVPNRISDADSGLSLRSRDVAETSTLVTILD